MTTNDEIIKNMMLRKQKVSGKEIMKIIQEDGADSFADDINSLKQTLEDKIDTALSEARADGRAEVLDTAGEYFGDKGITQADFIRFLEAKEQKIRADERAKITDADAIKILNNIHHNFNRIEQKIRADERAKITLETKDAIGRNVIEATKDILNETMAKTIAHQTAKQIREDLKAMGLENGTDYKAYWKKWLHE